MALVLAEQAPKGLGSSAGSKRGPAEIARLDARAVQAIQEIDGVAAAIRGTALIDDLPYTDPELSAAEKATVSQLVLAEMKGFKPPQYLKDLPASSDLDLEDAPLARDHLEKLAAGEALPPVPPRADPSAAPSGAAAASPAAWRRAIDGTGAETEAMKLKLMNTELLASHGVAAWQQRADDLAASRDQAQAALKEACTSLDAVNRERKAISDEHGQRLVRLQQRWSATAWRNQQLEVAVAVKEASVKRLQGEAEAKDGDAAAAGAGDAEGDVAMG